MIHAMAINCSFSETNIYLMTQDICHSIDLNISDQNVCTAAKLDVQLLFVKKLILKHHDET